MTSRVSKGKGKSVDKSTPWSDWTWDQPNGRYYRARQDSTGEYVYDVSPPTTQSAADPRSASSSNAVSTYRSTTESDAGDQDNSEYTFQDSRQGSSSVENLTSSFSATSLDGDQTPRPAYSVPYGQSASSTYYPQNADSRDYNAQPTSAYSGRSSSPVIVSSQRPIAGYTTSYGGGSNIGSNAPYSAQATAYTGAESSSSNPSYSQAKYYGTSSVPYPISESAAQQPQVIEKVLGSGPATQQPKLITGTAGSKEKLDPSYKIHHSKYFKRFQVFKVLWPEPQGQSGTEATEVTQEFGQHVHSSFRRFVIVVSGDGHCQCVPILTYGHQGTTKRGINPNHHAIIYTSKDAPKELEGEAPLRKRPIQVVPDTPRDKLSKDSRVNYAKIYTVEHNVKVLFTGRIAPRSEAKFLTDVDETWSQRTSAHDQ